MTIPIYQTVVFAGYVLAAFAIVVALLQLQSPIWLRLFAFLIGIYLMNAFLMVNISNFSPRYIYRLFFLVITVASLGFVLLGRRRQSMPPRPTAT